MAWASRWVSPALVWITEFPCFRSGQVRCGDKRRSSASPRPPCDGTPSSSVWPSPRQTPGSSCPYPSDRPPSGHRPGKRQARHARILQIGLRLAIAQADADPSCPYPSHRTPPDAAMKRVGKLSAKAAIECVSNQPTGDECAGILATTLSGPETNIKLPSSSGLHSGVWHMA